MLPVPDATECRWWLRWFCSRPTENLDRQFIQVGFGPYRVGDQRQALSKVNTVQRYSLGEFVAPHPHCDLPALGTNTPAQRTATVKSL